jgi:hypothetical protein
MSTSTTSPALIDPRVAAKGGTRKIPKAHYEFPGMADRRSWEATRVHKHTSLYGCALCGQRFNYPQAVYAHLAKRHGR